MTKQRPVASTQSTNNFLGNGLRNHLSRGYHSPGAPLPDIQGAKRKEKEEKKDRGQTHNNNASDELGVCLASNHDMHACIEKNAPVCTNASVSLDNAYTIARKGLLISACSSSATSASKNKGTRAMNKTYYRKARQTARRRPPIRLPVAPGSPCMSSLMDVKSQRRAPEYATEGFKRQRGIPRYDKRNHADEVRNHAQGEP